MVNAADDQGDIANNGGSKCGLQGLYATLSDDSIYQTLPAALVLRSLVTLMAVTAMASAPVVTHTPVLPALLSAVASTTLAVPLTTRQTRVSTSSQ